MARAQELVSINASTWVSVTNGAATNVTLQLQNLQFIGDKVLLRVAGSAPASNILTGWELSKFDQSSLVNLLVANLGAGGELWARTLRGGAAIFVATP